MDLVRYLYLLRRYGPVVLLVTLVGAGSTYFFVRQQPRVYQATTTLLINPAAPSQAIPYLQATLGNSGETATQQLADTYNFYLKTTSFTSLAIKALGLHESPGQLAGQISSNLVGATNFYLINATANSPEEAARIADGVATTFIQQNLALQRSAQRAASASPNQALLNYLQKQIKSVQALDQRLSSLNNASADAQNQLALVEARLNYLTTTYNNTLQQSSNSSAQAFNTATLTSPAGIPGAPISPKTRQDVLTGAAASCLLGVLLAFFLYYMDSSIRTPEDVERATGQLPLAVISLVGNRHRDGRRAARAAVPTGSNGVAPPFPASSEMQLFALQHPHDLVSESFRALRTNLAFSTLAVPTRTLVVTSLHPGEGKTTVASNLAVVLAQSGKQVILVDTDLRRPTLHQVFNVGRENGLTELLLGQATLAEALQPTPVANLRVLPCGTLPSNPAELLSYDAMIPLIEELKAAADMVIFDTPPMGALTDAVVLSTRVEGTMLVVKSGSVRPNVLNKGLEMLRKVGARPVGLVLNMVSASSLGSYAYYRSYYSYAQGKDASHAPSNDTKLPV